jgi:hypothetical protein
VAKLAKHGIFNLHIPTQELVIPKVQQETITSAEMQMVLIQFGATPLLQQLDGSIVGH